MKSVFLRLASSGIKKNKKLYIPYIISCIGSVMMYYIVTFLSESPAIKQMSGGTNLSLVLGIGKFVIVIFSLLFLFYTNSFLNRRRNKEFGLYNILGMDKKGICRVICWESLIVTLISIGAGLLAGIAFSKLAELCLLYLCKAQASYSFAIPPKTIYYTVTLYAVVFIALFIKSVIQVLRSDPLDLMKSESAGEKPPKANWVFAILGVLLLGGAYYLSITTESPLTALIVFFIAVIMVIIGTYMLFMAGSVALCKILQKSKKYYYKKNHFVSVSSMAYRMKRNGAGLASICILSTMVLVMVASTASLYFGANDCIKARYPQENQVSLHLYDVDNIKEEKASKYRSEFEKVFDKYSVKPQNVKEYGYASIMGLLSDKKLDPDSQGKANSALSFKDLRGLYFMDETTYNRNTGKNVKLNKGEAMVYTIRCQYDKGTIGMNDAQFNIVGALDTYPVLSDAQVAVTPSIMVVIHSMDELKPLQGLIDYNGDPMLTIRWYYGYDLKGSDKVAASVFDDILDSLDNINELKQADGGYSYTSDCLAKSRNDFYYTFGGFFFIGGLFSIMFIFAMAMIIYYKQMSEGFEDMKRFEIMQNIGMTKQDIKKSINSQTLTVFFAPLILAGIHFCCAFPPIWKLLQLFNLQNLTLVIIVSAIAFVIFGLIYMAIYKATARAYFSLVSKKE
ncbi:MAG: ABC transporter permease [Clostridia bacterium]|nr:ABC transporter permease [Clostridia bacterium]